MKSLGNEALNKRLINMRRALHEHPELAFEEYETTKTTRLVRRGRDHSARFPRSSNRVVCEIKGEQEGPTIALRADIDALPIEEASGEPFSSKIQGKCMHAVMISIPLRFWCGRPIKTNGNMSSREQSAFCSSRLKKSRKERNTS